MNKEAIAAIKGRGKIAVALSGGVDSALSAALLKMHGCDIHALFMKNWEEDDNEEGCGAREDLRYARLTCEQLGIPLSAINFSHEYWERVFSDFVNQYRRGLTPNPDVVCNREIKFSLLLEYAQNMGIGCLATGHYAGVEHDNHRHHLLKGADQNKDQSYFLYQLNQEALKHVVFPLAEYRKTEVRAWARKQRLASCGRPDSTGLCFIGERPFRAFLSRFISPRQGDIVDENGKLLGQHKGVWFYTIGQRSGLGVGGVAGSSAKPWYVAKKDIDNNQLTAVQRRDHPLLLRSEVTIKQIHWVAGPPATSAPLFARIRHRQPESPCRLQLQKDKKEAVVRFTESQWAVAAGQSLVFYQGRRCLGGGIIA